MFSIIYLVPKPSYLVQSINRKLHNLFLDFYTINYANYNLFTYISLSSYLFVIEFKSLI